MSKNRILHGSTKKQMHTQGQERVNCLKIKKRENWVNYLTEQCKNTSSQQYNKKKLKKIKKKIKKVIAGEEIQTDVLQSITNIIINPSKKWKELRSKDYLMTQTFCSLKKGSSAETRPLTTCELLYATPFFPIVTFPSLFSPVEILPYFCC